MTDQVSWLSPLHPSVEITISAEKLMCKFGNYHILPNLHPVHITFSNCYISFKKVWIKISCHGK